MVWQHLLPAAARLPCMAEASVLRAPQHWLQRSSIAAHQDSPWAGGWNSTLGPPSPIWGHMLCLRKVMLNLDILVALMVIINSRWVSKAVLKCTLLQHTEQNKLSQMICLSVCFPPFALLWELLAPFQAIQPYFWQIKLSKGNYKQAFPFQWEDLLSCFGQSDTLMLHPFWFIPFLFSLLVHWLIQN